MEKDIRGNEAERVKEANIRVHDIEAEIYDQIHPYIRRSFAQNRYQRFVNNALGLFYGREDISVLDIGCGTGHLTTKFLKKGCVVTGVDISQQMMEVCKKKVNDLGSKNRFKGIVSDIDDWLVANRDLRFDVICGSSVLHHFIDPNAILKKCIGLLNNNGVLLFVHERWKGRVPKIYTVLDWFDGRAARFKLKLEAKLTGKNFMQTLEQIESSDMDIAEVYGREGLEIVPIKKTLIDYGFNVELKKYTLQRFLITTCLVALIGVKKNFCLLAHRRLESHTDTSANP